MMRKQKTFIMTFNLGKTNPHYGGEHETFDRTMDNWIKNNVEPDTPIERYFTSAVVPPTSRVGESSWPELVVTHLLIYSPKTGAEK